MAKIIASINQTADGFCNHSDVLADEAHHGKANELLRESDLLLLGRKTYDLFYDFWPLTEKDETLPVSMQETGRRLNNIHKLVISKSLKSANWGTVAVISELTKDSLLQQTGKLQKNVLLLGSPSIFSALAAMDMIDEYVIFQQPVLAGKGERIFERLRLRTSQQLKLSNCQQLHNGVLILTYKPVETAR